MGKKLVSTNNDASKNTDNNNDNSNTTKNNNQVKISLQEFTKEDTSP